MRTSFVAAMLLATFCFANLAQANLITNGGFEAPVVGANFNYIAPTGWTIVNYGGLAASGTDTTPAPQGSQYGLLEIYAGNSSSLSQVVTFPTTGNYILKYVDADRTGIYGDLNYNVTLTQSGVTNIATGLNPTSTITFNPREFTFFAQAGTGTFSFSADGSNGQNRSAYFDAVSIEAEPVPAPEPTSLVLCGLGIVGLNIARRRRSGQA